MRRAITFIEGGEKELEKKKATWSPDVSRTASADDLALRRALAERNANIAGYEICVEKAGGGSHLNGKRIESFASTMSGISDSGFASEEDEDTKDRGEIKVESRLGLGPADQ